MEFPHPISLEVIEQIIASCSNQLPLILAGPLGENPCGNYGCAFSTSEGNVVKFTKHQKEADTASFIEEQQKLDDSHPGVPKIFDTWIWDDCHPYQSPVYVIHREPLDDLQIDREWFMNIVGSLEFDLYGKVEDNTISEDDIFEKLADLYQEYPGQPEDEIAVETVGDLYAWMLKHDRWLDDIDYENWGQRKDGTIVIRDLGAIKEIKTNYQY